MLLGRCAVGVLAFMCLSAGVTFAQAAEPQTVVEAFDHARSSGDVDAALAEFADNAVVIVQGLSTQTFLGKDQIRTYLSTNGVRVQMLMRSTSRVDGTSVTWIERDQAANQTIDATYSVVVENGQITSLQYRANTIFGASTGAAGPAPQEPRELPSAMWPAALSFLGLVALLVMSRRPGQSDSRLTGQLLSRMRSRGS
jgi:hypothetical protein